MEWKIPFYHLLNMMLTGVIFSVCCCIIFFDNVEYQYNSIKINDSILNSTIIGFCIFAIFYQIGLTINRLGSILIEPILYKFVKIKPDHSIFTMMSEKYPIMKILSREYALSRTQTTLFLLLTIIAFIFVSYKAAILPALLSILFLLSAIKHTLKINNLHKLNNKRK